MAALDDETTVFFISDDMKLPHEIEREPKEDKVEQTLHKRDEEPQHTDEVVVIPSAEVAHQGVPPVEDAQPVAIEDAPAVVKTTPPTAPLELTASPSSTTSTQSPKKNRKFVIDGKSGPFANRGVSWGSQQHAAAAVAASEPDKSIPSAVSASPAHDSTVVHDGHDGHVGLAAAGAGVVGIGAAVAAATHTRGDEPEATGTVPDVTVGDVEKPSTARYTIGAFDTAASSTFDDTPRNSVPPVPVPPSTTVAMASENGHVDADSASASATATPSTFGPGPPALTELQVASDTRRGADRAASSCSITAIHGGSEGNPNHRSPVATTSPKAMEPGLTPSDSTETFEAPGSPLSVPPTPLSATMMPVGPSDTKHGLDPAASMASLVAIRAGREGVRNSAIGGEAVAVGSPVNVGSPLAKSPAAVDDLVYSEQGHDSEHGDSASFREPATIENATVGTAAAATIASNASESSVRSTGSHSHAERRVSPSAGNVPVDTSGTEAVGVSDVTERRDVAPTRAVVTATNVPVPPGDHTLAVGHISNLGQPHTSREPGTYPEPQYHGPAVHEDKFRAAAAAAAATAAAATAAVAGASLAKDHGEPPETPAKHPDHNLVRDEKGAVVETLSPTAPSGEMPDEAAASPATPQLDRNKDQPPLPKPSPKRVPVPSLLSEADKAEEVAANSTRNSTRTATPTNASPKGNTTSLSGLTPTPASPSQSPPVSPTRSPTSSPRAASSGIAGAGAGLAAAGAGVFAGAKLSSKKSMDKFKASKPVERVSRGSIDASTKLRASIDKFSHPTADPSAHLREGMDRLSRGSIDAGNIAHFASFGRSRGSADHTGQAHPGSPAHAHAHPQPLEVDADTLAHAGDSDRRKHSRSGSISFLTDSTARVGRHARSGSEQLIARGKTMYAATTSSGMPGRGAGKETLAEGTKEGGDRHSRTLSTSGVGSSSSGAKSPSSGPPSASDRNGPTHSRQASSSSSARQRRMGILNKLKGEVKIISGKISKKST